MIYIYGCGGHGRSVADVVLACNPSEDLVFVDENAGSQETLFGFPVVRPTEVRLQSCELLIAVGDNSRRSEIFAKSIAAGLNIGSLISKRAYIGKEARVHRGVLVMHDVHVGPRAVIGANSILNTGCIVEHDCQIGDHSHIAPGAVICGGVTAGESVFIGAGATVKDGVKVGQNVTIGAGAVVVQDIPQPGTYVGVPARRTS